MMTVVEGVSLHARCVYGRQGLWLGNLDGQGFAHICRGKFANTPLSM